MGAVLTLPMGTGTDAIQPTIVCDTSENIIAIWRQTNDQGFLVLTGDVEYDHGEFRQWQREFRAANGKPARERTAPKAYERKSKPSFDPFMVEAFYLPDQAAIDAAVDGGILKVMRQGRQTSGQARQPKYALDLVKARLSQVLIAQLIF